MNALKVAAGQGVTVIMVIHQPRYSVFEALDDLILLAQGGTTVYSGPASDAQPYFEVGDPRATFARPALRPRPPLHANSNPARSHWALPSTLVKTPPTY